MTIAAVKGAGDAAGRQPDEREKEVIFKNCALFTNCISINNTQIDNAKDLDVVMQVYKLLEYINNYSKKSRGW